MLERSWCGGATCQSAGDGAENGSASASGGESFSSPAHHLFPGCVWVDPTAPGADMGADQSAWMDVSGIDKVHQLWLYRYYLAGEALKRGKNVLMADTDGASQQTVTRIPPLSGLNPRGAFHASPVANCQVEMCRETCRTNAQLNPRFLQWLSGTTSTST